MGQQSRISTLTSESKEIKKKLAAAKKEVDTKVKAFNKLTKSFQKLEGQSNSQAEEIENLKEQINKLKDAEKLSKRKVTDLKKKLKESNKPDKKHKKELEKLRVTLQEQTKELESVQSTLKEQTQEVNRLSALEAQFENATIASSVLSQVDGDAAEKYKKLIKLAKDLNQSMKNIKADLEEAKILKLPFPKKFRAIERGSLLKCLKGEVEMSEEPKYLSD